MYIFFNYDLDINSADDLVMCLPGLNWHVGRHIDGFDLVREWYGVGLTNLEGRMLLDFCLKKELCVSNTWLGVEKKRKVTFWLQEYETEIDFVLIKRTPAVYARCEVAIPGEFQHALLLADIDKRKCSRKQCSERDMYWVKKDEFA